MFRFYKRCFDFTKDVSILQKMFRFHKNVFLFYKR